MDVQEDYLASPSLSPPAPVLIEGLTRLLSAWRGLGLPVVHCQTQVHPDGSNRMPHLKRADRWLCVEGEAGMLPPHPLAPVEGEFVLAKPFFSAFSNAELLPLLRRLDPGALVVAGLHTHACIRCTVLDAYQNGFQIWVAGDGIASDDPIHADLTRQYLESRACEFLSADDILLRLDGRAPALPSPPEGPVEPSVFLGGRWQESRGNSTWTQRNPSDWRECIAHLRIGVGHDVDLAASRAAAGHGLWRNESVPSRLSCLSRWADALKLRRHALVACLVRELGKPVADAEAECSYALALIQSVLSQDSLSDEETIAPGVSSRRRPLGVVGLITPWNNPLAIPIGKIAPALAWGNAVLWKPALPGPGVARLLLESLMEAGLPDDCITAVLGDASTAHWVIRHPLVQAVSFTGSESAGRQVASMCLAAGKPFQAELGGNNPVLGWSFCDTDRVAAEVVGQAFSFAGQRCTAPRRLIVDRARLDEWTACLVAQASALTMGSPEDPATRLGPLLSRARQAGVAGLVAGALKDGARLLHGGGIPLGFEQGCWYEPTLLVSPNSAARIVQEESFGPILVIQPAEDFEEAIRLCNDVPQGLVATLHTDQPELQRRFLQETRAGILRVGLGQGAIHPDAPFGGWKSSGVGPPEHGKWDGEFYARPQALYGPLAGC